MILFYQTMIFLIWLKKKIRNHIFKSIIIFRRFYNKKNTTKNNLSNTNTEMTFLTFLCRFFKELGGVLSSVL